MKLATVEIVESIRPIPWADKIELARVLGWEVIVKKGLFSPGDRCVYIPIDTVVDTTKQWFAELVKTNGRINTLRLRDVYSQGYVLRPNDLCMEFPNELGTDIAELVGVRKYEKETQGSIQNFPAHIVPRTDEDNLRSKNNCLGEIRGKAVYVTKKMDGSSMTLIWKQGEFMLCSRNVILQHLDKTGNVMVDFDNKSMQPMKNFVKKRNASRWFPDRNIAIQGEFCGPGFNANQMKLKDHVYYVFNVKDLDNDKWFGLEELQRFVEQQELNLVPLLDMFECSDEHTIEHFQELANAVKYDEREGEGIVVRPVIPCFSEALEKMLSFKIINQKYKD